MLGGPNPAVNAETGDRKRRVCDKMIDDLRVQP